MLIIKIFLGSDLQNALDDQLGSNKATVSDNGDGSFNVSLIDSKRDYIISSSGINKGINWNEAMKTTKAPSDQTDERNKNVIGIGTDGKAVNMDLWEYTLLDDGTFGLNDLNSINDINKNKGYLGSFNNGSIIGTIPQYISIDSGNTFIPVTNLFATFCEISEITIMPVIPSTVTNLTNTFIRCSNLKTLSPLPNSVILLGGTFKGCTSLTKAISLPNKVTNIGGLFSGCINLETGPSEIPESVTIMNLCFLDCAKLNGTIILKANVTGYPIISDDHNDFYRSFYGASLKANNVNLKILLPNNTYTLFNSQIAKVYNASISNITLEVI